MGTPRISVVVPVHNPGRYLAPALASIRGQSIGDFELLCLDDGCTDGSASLLADAAAADPRIRILSPGRIGLVAAANRLMVEARAPYIARFDADDLMDARRLELQAAFLDAHEDIGAVGSLVRHFPHEEVGEGARRYEEWLNGLVTPEAIHRDIFVELPLANPSAMMRAEVFREAGGYVDDGLPEDYAFWLRAWEAGVRFAKVPEVLHHWREHPRRVTRTHPRYSVEAFLKAKVATLLRTLLVDEPDYVIWGAGMMGRRLARLLVRAGRPPRALLDIDRKKIGRRRQGAPILPPEAIRPCSALLLGAVGARGAREKIRARLTADGWLETTDFWMVA